jgi:hypothetical protein
VRSRRAGCSFSAVDAGCDQLVEHGIDIVERVPIPDELIPPDAHVEIEAKKAAGYYTSAPEAIFDLTEAIGRPLEKY